jgi:hypothetical protein
MVMTAAAVVLVAGAALGMGTAHADSDGYGTDDDSAYEMGACLDLSRMVGLTPAQTELALLNGNKHTAQNPNGHITPEQAHAIVRDQIAAGCQNTGGYR